MRRLRVWMSRLAGAFLARRRADDFDREIESHLQLHIDDNLRAGMPPDEARRAAIVRLGGIGSLREEHRARAGVPVFQHFTQDVRYGVRVLRRNPAFSAIAIITLALGIGANTSIFTLVNAILLRPLPYADADRLVMVWATDTAQGVLESSASYPDFEAWREAADGLEEIAAVTTRSVILGGAEQPELVPAVQTTARFFRVLGVEAQLGRVFTDGDGEPDAPPVAVLSDGAWQRLFGGRPEALGATITVNEKPFVVVGVVPGRMHFIPTEAEQVYTLLPRETNREHGYLRVIGRLRSGVALPAVRAELDVVAARLAAAFPRTNANTGVNVVPLAAAAGAPMRDALLILLALVGAVLLIACTNVANLLLARNASRQHELALRMSLGAGRRRIVQQLLTESILLALAGGGAGVLIAPLLTGALTVMVGDDVPVPRIEDIGIDATVLAFALLVSILTGILFGVVPAVLAAPRAVAASVGDAGRTIAGAPRGRRTRSALVVVETALALVLLAAGAMLGRSFLQLRGTPSGFEAEGVLAVGLRLPPSLGPGAGREAFFNETRARLANLPGVRASGFVANLPMAGGRDTLQFKVSGEAGAKPVSANFNIASPGYFQTMRIPLVEGREFAAADGPAAPLAIIVNETAARRYWPGRSAVGGRIVLTGRTETMTVVGVTGDVRQSDLGTSPRPEIYLCALQPGPDWPAAALVVRTASEPNALVADVRTALRAANRDVAIARTGTMDDVVAGRLAQPRIYTMLLGAFALVALLLAAVGLYGVIAYSVAQRSRELGIRLALGSAPGALVRSVLAQATALTAGGILIGLFGAYAATQTIAGLLPGARAGDPLTLSAAAGLMFVVATAASYFPARRAARVDPLTVLRTE